MRGLQSADACHHTAQGERKVSFCGEGQDAKAEYITFRQLGSPSKGVKNRRYCLREEEFSILHKEAGLVFEVK